MSKFGKLLLLQCLFVFNANAFASEIKSGGQEAPGGQDRKVSDSSPDVSQARFLLCPNGHRAIACQQSPEAESDAGAMIVCETCSGIFSQGPRGPYWELTNSRRLSAHLASFPIRFYLAQLPGGLVPVPLEGSELPRLPEHQSHDGNSNKK